MVADKYNDVVKVLMICDCEFVLGMALLWRLTLRLSYQSFWGARHSTRTGKFFQIQAVSLSLQFRGVSFTLCKYMANFLFYVDHCQPAISKIDLYVTVVLNVVTDMYLMSIPLPVRQRRH